ncbi:hypothetical protein R2F61_03605 [Mollicutes bacterium LVI A0078]|nr:hypothetical protein RZE84_03635 [Mollicutes bacterium LVI A0075]WOO91649.1 hypothetical protein R2F61_03605 [Mollicutes bacterium LVI A0078]
MKGNPFEVNNSKDHKHNDQKKIKQQSKYTRQITAEESTAVLRKNVAKAGYTSLALLIGGAILYPPITSNSEYDLDQSFEDIVDDTHLSEEDFYDKFNIEPLTDTWQWNPDDFIDYQSEDVDTYDFMVYDSFSGEDTVLNFTTQEEEIVLDLSTITPGIYTVENTSDLGYIYIGFGDYDGYLTVYNEEPIYNVPITEDTIIELKSLDYGETNSIKFTFTKQDDYVNHDQDHLQGIFITGKSMFDNTEYDGEHQVAYYPKADENELDLQLFDDSNVYNVPGSVFFSNTH